MGNSEGWAGVRLILAEMEWVLKAGESFIFSSYLERGLFAYFTVRWTSGFVSRNTTSFLFSSQEFLENCHQSLL